MHSIFIGIGSNIDRVNNIDQGLAHLENTYGDLILSSVYESVPYGFDADNFYNLVAHFFTDSSLEKVHRRLKEIEICLGRVENTQKFMPRALDLDLLLYDDLINEGEVIVPREDLLKYSFVLCPMAEIAPDLRHPIQQKTYQQLWDEFDKSITALWKVAFERNATD